MNSIHTGNDTPASLIVERRHRFGGEVESHRAPLCRSKLDPCEGNEPLWPAHVPCGRVVHVALHNLCAAAVGILVGGKLNARLRERPWRLQMP